MTKYNSYQRVQLKQTKPCTNEDYSPPQTSIQSSHPQTSTHQKKTKETIHTVGVTTIDIKEEDKSKPTFALYTGTESDEEKEMVRAMLSESLQAVISQTLLKTKDGNGRVAAHEIMLGTPAIRNLIRENKVAQMYSSIQTGNSFGMQTLDQCLQDLVRKGRVTPAEARSKAKIPENFPG